MDRASCNVGDDGICADVEARRIELLCAGRRLSSNFRPSVVAIVVDMLIRPVS